MSSTVEHADYRLIGRVRKSNREEFRISVRNFTNFRGVELRVYQTDGEGVFRETQRGVAMRAAALPAVIEALQKAAIEMEGAR